MSDAILSVKNLKKHYTIKKGIFNKVVDVVKAVDDISFEIKKGQTLGIVGESGCGKSTLGKIIVRLEENDHGNIVFDNKDILSMNKEEFRKIRPDIQIIFQNPFNCLNPKMKIKDILSEAVLEHNIVKDKKEVEKYLVEILTECGLSIEHLDRYPSEFSGGQLQRIAIARAISLKPKLIIADEVVSALDLSVQEQILGLFENLKENRNVSIMFISHDLSVIKRVSDFIIVMQKGKIIEKGSIDEIFNETKHDFTKSLINSIVKFSY